MSIRAAAAWLTALIVAAAALAQSPGASAATVVTWTGGGSSNNWSDAANWTPGIPVAGDTIVFPAAAARKTNTNNLPPASYFRIRFDGSGYTINGNPVNVMEDVTNQPASGTNQVNVDISGLGAILQESGRLTLAGNNSFSGDVEITGGSVHALSNTALGNITGETIVSAGGTLELSGGVDTGSEVIRLRGDGFDGDGALQSLSGTNEVGSLILLGDVVIGVGNSTLIVGNLAQDGVAALTLIGGGKLQVEGSAFSGPVDVEHGNFTFNASSQAFVNVRRDGWLRGTGEVASASVTAGLIWPGSGTAPGILTVDGATTFTSGRFRVDIDGPIAGSGYGQLETSGLTLASAATLLELDLTYQPVIGTVFVIIKNHGGAVAGTFTGLPEGAIIHAGNIAFEVSYKGGDGNDVTLRALRQVAADLKVELAASPSPASTGGLLAFIATVTNDGPDEASNISLAMGTPEGTTFESFTAPAGWTCAKPSPSPTVTCTGPKLANGQSAQITLMFRVNAPAGTTLSGTAGVSASTPDPFSGDNSDTLQVPVGSGGSGVPRPFKRYLPGIAADSAGSAGS